MAGKVTGLIFIIEKTFSEYPFRQLPKGKNICIFESFRSIPFEFAASSGHDTGFPRPASPSGSVPD